MNFACPHCTQTLEAADEWAGQAVACPSCQQALAVPSVPAIPRPKVAPTPQAPRRSFPSKPPRRGGGGFGKFLLLLIILAGAGFGYLMVHFKESPQQAWKRLVDAAERFATPSVPKPMPAPTPAIASEPAPAQVPATMPEPIVAPESAAKPIDPLAWLLEHKDRAPREVVLQRPATLAIWDNGDKIGSVIEPVRTRAQVVGFTAETVSVRVGYAAGEIPIGATNLRAIAKAEQEKAMPNQAAFAVPPEQVPPAQVPAVNAATTFPAPRFEHPSVPFSREDLELLKVNIKREPWKSGFEALAAEGRSKLDYKMQGPFEEVKRKPNVNLYPWRSDMIAVHNLAVMWYFTGEPVYAQKARDILIAYAKTEKVFGGSEAGLDLGDFVWYYAVGADILRGTWPGWTKSDTDLVKKLFAEVYWPGLGINDHIVGPANKGVLVAAAGAGIAAFCDDREKLEHVASLVRKSAGSGLLNTLPTGQHGETGRDAGHAYHTWACLAFTAEILWKQGIDIYSEMDNRIFATGEYYARNNLGWNSPFVISGSVDAVYWRSSPGVGWQSARRRAMALLHGAYAVRKGMVAPYLERYRQAMPLGGGEWMYEKSEDRSTAIPPPPVVFPATARVSSGLSDADIGGARPAGGSRYRDGIWTVTGGGDEVWTHDADSCHFTYKEVSGDCAIIAKLESMDGTDPDARAGVMIRSDVTGTADNRAWLGAKPGHKLEFFQHGWTGLWSGSYREKGNRDFPESESYWMKIERLGNVISLYLSCDGASWFAASAAEYKLPETMSIGLMVCSKTNGSSIAARFSHVSITGGNGAPVLAAPEAPRNLMASPGPKQVPLRWLNSHDAAAYTVKRSPTKGGPYTTIAKVAGNSYTDADVANDTTYYYVVSAENSVGESPNSPEDTATPRALMWNVTFGGTATATVAEDAADKVFDSNTATRWFAGRNTEGAVEYDFGFGRAPVIERYTVTSANDVPERDPKDWELQGSSDGASWTTLDTQIGQTFPARFYEMEYAVAKPVAYRYYRLNITANSGAEGLQVADVKLLSRQPIPNAPVSALIHWRANDTADREQATEAIESFK